MNDMVKNLLLWVVIAIVLLTVFQSFNPRNGGAQEMFYSDFLSQVDNNNVAEVLIHNDHSSIEGRLRDGAALKVNAPFDEKLVDRLVQHKVKIKQEASDSGPFPPDARHRSHSLPLYRLFRCPLSLSGGETAGEPVQSAVYLALAHARGGGDLVAALALNALLYSIKDVLRDRFERITQTRP